VAAHQIVDADTMDSKVGGGVIRYLNPYDQPLHIATQDTSSGREGALITHDGSSVLSYNTLDSARRPARIACITT